MKKTFLILMAALPLFFFSCGPDNPDNPGGPDDSGETIPDKSDTYGIKALDLGLSVEWASANIGADIATASGDFFAWGETKTKDIFKWETYKYGATSDALTKYNASDGLKVL